MWVGLLSHGERNSLSFSPSLLPHRHVIKNKTYIGNLKCKNLSTLAIPNRRVLLAQKEIPTKQVQISCQEIELNICHEFCQVEKCTKWFKRAWSDFSKWRFWFKWCVITQEILVSNFSKIGHSIRTHEEITYIAIASYCTDSLCTNHMVCYINKEIYW